MSLSNHALRRRALTDVAKREIIERLSRLWFEHPTLRLGQLIVNVEQDPYYIEDFDLLNAMEQRYGANFGVSE